MVEKNKQVLLSSQLMEITSISGYGELGGCSKIQLSDAEPEESDDHVDQEITFEVSNEKARRMRVGDLIELRIVRVGVVIDCVNILGDADENKE